MVTSFDLKSTLRIAGLSVTQQRVSILGFLHEKQEPVSRLELAAVFPEINRVTMYRILQQFESAGFIERHNDGTAEFFVVNKQSHSENSEHLHFTCSDCHRIICIPEISIDDKKIPTGFVTQKISITATGLCPECSFNQGKR